MWSEETHRGIRTIRWGDEAMAQNPTEHGRDDWLITNFGNTWADCSRQPTALGIVFQAAFIGKAQWDSFQGRKRDDLWILDWLIKTLGGSGGGRISTDEIHQHLQKYAAEWERYRAGRS